MVSIVSKGKLQFGHQENTGVIIILYILRKLLEALYFWKVTVLELMELSFYEYWHQNTKTSEVAFGLQWSENWILRILILVSRKLTEMFYLVLVLFFQIRH